MARCVYHYAKMSHMTLNAEKNEHYDRKKNELPLVHDKNQWFFFKHNGNMQIKRWCWAIVWIGRA